MLQSLKPHKSANLVLTLFCVCAFIFPAHAQLLCQPSGSPATTFGSLNASDSMQTGRIVRDGNPSSCTGKTNSLQNSNGVKYDAYNFTNRLVQNACVTVDVDFTGCNFNDIEAVAYSNYDPANPAANVIGDLGFSAFDRGSFSFPVAAGADFTIVVHEITPNSGCPVYSFAVSYSTNCRQAGFDLTNDGRADLALFKPNGVWSIINSANGATSNTLFGFGTDIPTGADYSGDGLTDIGVFRPENGVWYQLLSPNNTFSATQWGQNDDVPVHGDYDRDGKADIAVWRASNGVWYILRSADFSFQAFLWGLAGDKPVPGDYDGDRRNDLAIYRPADPASNGNGVWYVMLSNFNNSFLTILQWGLPSDKPVAADYDGDGITDIAVYRPSDGIWYMFLSSAPNGNPFRGIQFGISEDIPQPADYDGDGKADVAVFRPSSNLWYILGSSTGVQVIQFGSNGDRPSNSHFGKSDAKSIVRTGRLRWSKWSELAFLSFSETFLS
jgi:hypothetical protein